MKKLRHRSMIALNDSDTELLRGLESKVGLSPAQIIQNLTRSHVGELWIYKEWMEALPPGPSMKRNLGVALMLNYTNGDMKTKLAEIDALFTEKA